MPVPGYGPNTPPVAILKPISAALAAPGRLAKEALAATSGDSSAISGAVETASSKRPIVALGPLRGNCAIRPPTRRTAAQTFPQYSTIGLRRTVLAG
jgi:hypothetical protein